MRLVRKLLPFLAVMMLAGTLAAQSASAATDAGVQADRIAQLQQQIADAKGSADNAWMLMSCRAGAADDRPRPGAILRRPGAQEKCAGHHDAELCHDGDHHRALGDYRLQPLLRVGQQLSRRDWSTRFCRAVGAAPDADYAATIPQQTFMVYQLMFAIITPALICGAFAERMKFSAMVLFMVLWSLLVYCADGAHGVG